MYVSGSPSGSVALPVSANGVRGGIVYAVGTVTSGAWLPVGVMVKPWLVGGPPWLVSPTKPVAPVGAIVSDGRSMPAKVPPNDTWKPCSLNAPPKKPVTATVPPVARMPALPLVVSATVPAAPTALVTASGSRSCPASVPPKSSV